VADPTDPKQIEQMTELLRLQGQAIKDMAIAFSKVNFEADAFHKKLEQRS
jgi:hypothetical protein